MKNMIDWDAELTRAQIRLETGMTDNEIHEAMKAFRKIFDMFIAKLAELVDAIAKQFQSFAEAIAPLAELLHIKEPQNRLEVKQMWPKPKREKRPFSFVAYNQIPAKRPLHKGRRGRR